MNEETKKQVLLDAPSPHHPMPEQERRVFFLLFPNELKLCFGFFVSVFVFSAVVFFPFSGELFCAYNSEIKALQ